MGLVCGYLNELTFYQTTSLLGDLAPQKPKNMQISGPPLLSEGWKISRTSTM